MTKDPAVLFYTSDFLSGTSFLTYEEKGQYITLLCQQHQSYEIPENHMINICGSLESPVLKKFIRTKSGFYYNERMRIEGERRRSFCESRSNNKSGRPKKEIIRESHDSKMNTHMETENENDNKDTIGNENHKKDVVDIIADLNHILGTSYKNTIRVTKELITARINEGFTVDDFKQVHRKMVKTWGADQKMYKYLRPKTLYSNKFESYLNQKEPITKLTETGIKAYLIGQEWLKKQKEAVDVR